MQTSRRSARVIATLALGLASGWGCSSDAVSDENQGQAPATTIGTDLTDALPTESIAAETEMTDPTTVDTPTLHRAIAMVLESSEHGPELCLGGVASIMPPQCGGIPLIGWDWATVDDEETANSVIWVDSAVVTGNYDGASLTVTDVRSPTEADFADVSPSPELRAPCPEPEGGWLAAAADAPIDRGSNLGIGSYMETQPDQVGWFYDQSLNADIDSGINDPRKFIIVALFTGDIERHQAELEAIWPGALCVAQAERSAAEMEALATQVLAGLGPAGELALPNGVILQLLSYSPSGEPLSGTVPIEVVVVPAGAQEYFDETYGPGVVVLNAQLRPVA